MVRTDPLSKRTTGRAPIEELSATLPVHSLRPPARSGLSDFLKAVIADAILNEDGIAPPLKFASSFFTLLYPRVHFHPALMQSVLTLSGGKPANLNDN
jgi:hypothetical protein